MDRYLLFNMHISFLHLTRSRTSLRGALNHDLLFVVGHRLFERNRNSGAWLIDWMNELMDFTHSRWRTATRWWHNENTTSREQDPIGSPNHFTSGPTPIRAHKASARSAVCLRRVPVDSAATVRL